MAQTDCWSHQERVIHEIFSMGHVLASGTISEGDMLEFTDHGTGAYGAKGVTADGVIEMESSTSLCGAHAIALKAASDDDTLPAMFFGVHKLTVAGTSAAENTHKIFAGSLVCNSSSASKIVGLNKACGVCTATGSAFSNFATGLSHILGVAMQLGNNTDEILVLVGRSI